MARQDVVCGPRPAGQSRRALGEGFGGAVSASASTRAAARRGSKVRCCEGQRGPERVPERPNCEALPCQRRPAPEHAVTGLPVVPRRVCCVRSAVQRAGARRPVVTTGGTLGGLLLGKTRPADRSARQAVYTVLFEHPIRPARQCTNPPNHPARGTPCLSQRDGCAAPPVARATRIRAR